jgi:hypothetical protein
MSFLDNSGDIILDAVLTDEGRRRLAKGQFTIDKFALGDDEINYNLYDKTQSTAQKDTNIMKSPVFEALTSSPASMKYHLLSYRRNDILYLPVARVNTNTQPSGYPYASTNYNGDTANQFVVIVDQNTYYKYTDTAATPTAMPTGFILGTSGLRASDTPVVVNQGIDNAETFGLSLDPDLEETGFYAEMDSRFGSVCDVAGNIAWEAFTDANHITTQLLAGQIGSKATPGLIMFPQFEFFSKDAPTGKGTTIIKGAPGRTLKFSIVASSRLASSIALFERFGTEVANYFPAQKSGSRTAMAIDRTLRLTGMKTGMTLEIPIRFVRAP